MFRRSAIDESDDYHKVDPLAWWQSFTTKLGLHDISEHLKIAVLYLNTTGTCQIWLNHPATHEGVNIQDLHTKLAWDTITAKWKNRFIVTNVPRHEV